MTIMYIRLLVSSVKSMNICFVYQSFQTQSLRYCNFYLKSLFVRPLESLVRIIDKDLQHVSEKNSLPCIGLNKIKKILNYSLGTMLRSLIFHNLYNSIQSFFNIGCLKNLLFFRNHKSHPVGCELLEL